MEKNSEVYKTAQERAEAFRRFCNSFNDHCHGCPVAYDCSMKDDIRGSFAWLDLEAEEEKPLPCPFCGGETEARNCVGGWCVQCDCGYVSKQFNKGDDDEMLKADAIAAHNRVAKAVRESEGHHE